MTGPQYEALTGIREIAPAWFRARGNGERPVLVNLWQQGTLVRRAHRRGKCARDNAYEYREAAELYSSGELTRRSWRYDPNDHFGELETPLRCPTCRKPGPHARLTGPCGVTGCECSCNR